MESNLKKKMEKHKLKKYHEVSILFILFNEFNLIKNIYV